MTRLIPNDTVSLESGNIIGGIEPMGVQQGTTGGAPAAGTVTIFLADGRDPARARLRRDFESHGFQVIGEASHGGEALERVSQLRPDVLVMNLAMPGLNGRQVAERVLHGSPHTRVVVFWAYGNVAYVLENVPSGIMAHLVRVPGRGHLIRAVQETIGGGGVPEMARFWPRAHAAVVRTAPCSQP